MFSYITLYSVSVEISVKQQKKCTDRPGAKRLLSEILPPKRAWDKAF